MTDWDLELHSMVASYFTQTGIYKKLETQLADELDGSSQESSIPSSFPSSIPSSFPSSLTHFRSTDPRTPSRRFRLIVLDIPIDPLRLMSHSPRLAGLVLERPRVAQRLFASVVFASLGDRIPSPANLTAPELTVRFSIPFLPKLPTTPASDDAERFCVASVRDVIRRNSDDAGLVLLRGVVISATPPVKYVSATLFSCGRLQCPFFGESLWRVMRFGDEELDPQSPFKSCPECGKRMAEDAAQRCIADCVTFAVLPSKTFGVTDRAWAEGVVVTARESFVDGVLDIRVGDSLEVIGLAEKRLRIWQDSSVHVEAINWRRKETTIDPRSCLHAAPRFNDLPESILRLIASTIGSPWRFTWTLAFLSANGVAPPSTFHRLKLTLLLSLALAAGDAENLTRLRIDLLVCGGETTTIERLLEFFGRLAPNFRRHSALTPLLSKTSKSNSVFSADADSLLLSRDGVCLVGQLAHLKNSQLDALKHTLECHDATSRRGAAASSTSQPPPRNCVVWCCCEVEEKDGKTSPVARGLEEVFPVRVFTDSPDLTANEETTSILAEFILEMSPNNNNNDSESLSRFDLVSFFTFAARSTPDLTPEAQALLSAYFAVARKRGAAFPISGAQTLASFAVAHAKLRLSDQANEGDALAAILLLEESATSQLGFSPFGVLPRPHVNGPLHSVDERIMAELYDKLLNRLDDLPEIDIFEEE